MKSDKSIKSICIASVKRHTIKPIDFRWTNLFEDDKFINNDERLILSNGELCISQTFIDSSNWTIVTTRRIVSCFENNIKEVIANKISSWNWGNFKRNETPLTTGELTLDNGELFRIHIETGRASMILIYSIMTLVGQIKSQ